MVFQQAGGGGAMSGASCGYQLSTEELTVTCLAPLPLELQLTIALTLDWGSSLTDNTLWKVAFRNILLKCLFSKMLILFPQLLSLSPKVPHLKTKYMLIAIEDESYTYLNSQMELSLQFYNESRWKNLNYILSLFWQSAKLHFTRTEKFTIL